MLTTLTSSENIGSGHVASTRRLELSIAFVMLGQNSTTGGDLSEKLILKLLLTQRQGPNLKSFKNQGILFEQTSFSFDVIYLI